MPFLPPNYRQRRSTEGRKCCKRLVNCASGTSLRLPCSRSSALRPRGRAYAVRHSDVIRAPTDVTRHHCFSTVHCTSSVKPEVHNVSHRRQNRTEPWSYTNNSVKIGHVVLEICSRREREIHGAAHTHGHAHHNYHMGSGSPRVPLF